MEVIIPGLRDQINNPFFDEVIACSQYSFSYSLLNEITPAKGDIILFQWPELIFNWQEPEQKDLNILQEKIKEWKKIAPIIYLVHNERRHYGMTPRFEKLYEIVENSADVMVHFGYFSKNLFFEKYPYKKHVVINHPVYHKPGEGKSKKEAREELGIPQDRIVLIVPGLIRSLEERSLVLKVFRWFPASKKSLLAPRMYWKSSKLKFKGRNRLKKIIDVKHLYELRNNFFFPPFYYFGYSYRTESELSVLMTAADALIIPRTDVLNSGNLYLGLGYGLPVAGPSCGNIREILESFGTPHFDNSDENSIKTAMKNLYDIIKGKFKIEDNRLTMFQPSFVATEWDDLIASISGLK